MKRTHLMALCLSLAGASAGCAGSSSSVVGDVVDEKGTPVAGAGVEVVGQPGVVASADANGHFTLNGATPAGSATVLRFAKPGYGSAYRDIALTTDAPYYMKVSLLTAPAAHMIDAGQEGTVTEGAVTVKVPASAFCNGAGSVVTGMVGMTVIPYDAVDLTLTPAPLLTVDGKSLASLGMTDIQVAQGGEALSLCSNGQLSVTTLVQSGLDISNIADYHDWEIDPTRGLWKDMGKGTYDAGTHGYTSTTRTLQPHNTDVDAPTAHVSGTVTDAHHQPVPSLGVNVHVCSIAGCEYQSWDRDASTNASGAYASDPPIPHNGDLIKFAILNSPTTLPGQRLMTTPADITAMQNGSYPNQNFQYCLLKDEHCVGTDLCCNGACADGLCP